MHPVSIYSSKASLYAKYRWDYAPGAVETIFRRTGIDSRSTVVELGAGTGILTRHLAGKAGRVIALEPDLQMIHWVRQGLPEGDAVGIAAATAEFVPLIARCADAILVAQAIHWFHPIRARQEMLRLLKHGGWLVLLRNYGTDKQLGEAIAAIDPSENGVEPHPQKPPFPPQSPGFYFSHGRYTCQTFQFTQRQDWPAFLGGLLTASYSPEVDHPLFETYCRKARQVFDQLAPGGWLDSTGETELILGQVEA